MPSSLYQGASPNINIASTSVRTAFQLPHISNSFNLFFNIFLFILYTFLFFIKKRTILLQLFLPPVHYHHTKDSYQKYQARFQAFLLLHISLLINKRLFCSLLLFCLFSFCTPFLFFSFCTALFFTKKSRFARF